MGSVETDQVWLSEIARRLNVPRQNVWNWWRRRKRTKFPDSVGHITLHGRKTRVWDWSAVETWKAGYVPDLGGRPPLKKPVDMSRRTA